MLSERIRKSIKKKMIDKGIKGTYFANELKVSRQFISGILNGKMSNERIEKYLLDWKSKN